MGSRRSSLHLQLGQETVYLIMAIAVFAALVMAALLMRQSPERQKDPPIIPMREADGFSFPTGSAAISSSFRDKLVGRIVPEVVRIGRESGTDVVEVIGHTDGVPLRHGSRYSANLDRVLMPAFTGQPADAAQAADNVGLGMARAVAVARLLRDAPSLRRFQIMPLSAGAFERTDDTMADGSTLADDPGRRRIVIRVRRRVRKGDEVATAG